MNMRVSSSLIRSLLIVSLAFVSASCLPTAPATQDAPDSDIQDVRVVQATEPTKATAKVEQFPLPNCGGTDRLVQSLGMYASAIKRATVGAKATIRGGGEVAIPETARLKLEIQVEASYQKTFESANSRLDSIEMSAAARTHVVYAIVWEEQTFNSVVQYSADGKVHEAPYTYRLTVPKIDTSYNVICPSTNQEGVANTPQPAPQPQSPTSPSETRPAAAAPSPMQNVPLREHQTVSIGTGAFERVTFSDGLAPYDENWLWANNHFNIQRIRPEENPDGCGSAQYPVTKIWIGVSALAKVTVKGAEIGTITTITPLQKHGFIADVSLNVGDVICVSPVPAGGFQIVFGPDIYYHHDSYCYRGSC